MRCNVLDDLVITRVRRGGFGLLCILALLLSAPVVHADAPEATQKYPATTDELVTTVKAAIEAKDFAAIDNLINWTAISDYKRREFTSHILHGLGRPVAKIEIEQVDDETRDNLLHLKNHKLNMQVSHLLRVTYADGEPGGVVPAAVFLVGRMADVYRIGLLVKDKGTTEND
jgi:hypothetical protein